MQGYERATGNDILETLNCNVWFFNQALWERIFALLAAERPKQQLQRDQDIWRDQNSWQHVTLVTKQSRRSWLVNHSIKGNISQIK